MKNLKTAVLHVLKKRYFFRISLSAHVCVCMRASDSVTVFKVYVVVCQEVHLTGKCH
jgi:hypothetical protein